MLLRAHVVRWGCGGGGGGGSDELLALSLYGLIAGGVSVVGLSLDMPPDRGQHVHQWRGENVIEVHTLVLLKTETSENTLRL